MHSHAASATACAAGDVPTLHAGVTGNPQQIGEGSLWRFSPVNTDCIQVGLVGYGLVGTWCTWCTRGREICGNGGCFLEKLELRISAVWIEVHLSSFIACRACSGQELVRQMIKEGPSLEEKIGVGLPVTCHDVPSAAVKTCPFSLKEPRSG